MENLVFDVSGEWHKYEARCTLSPKFKTFMVYGNEDKALDHKKNRTFRWKQAGAFNTKDDNGIWHAVAKNTEILKAMAAVMGPIALDDVASARFKELDNTLIASRAEDAVIDIPCPEGVFFYPFQRAGVKYAIDKYDAGNIGVLNGDDMGVGKTVQGLGVINYYENITRAIVICPKSVKINWMREAIKWLNRPFVVVVGDTKPGVTSYGDLLDSLGNDDCPHMVESNADDATNLLFVLSYENLKNWLPVLLQGRFDLGIFDEVHLCKNKKSQRYKHSFGEYITKTKTTEPGLSSVCALRLGLTGTPIENFPIELYTIANALQPGVLGKFQTYAERYCNAFHNGYGWDYTGARNMPELQLKLRQKFMIRRLKTQVLTEIPPKTRQVIELAPNGSGKILEQEAKMWSKHHDVMSTIQAEIDLALAAGDKKAYEDGVAKLGTSQKFAFQEMAAERHDIAMQKVPYVVEFVENLLENVDKAIIFAHHSDAISEMMEAFKAYNPVSIIGDHNIHQRDAAVQAFQNDPKVRLIICSIRAAGVGLTLTAAHHVIFAEFDWKPGAMEQAIDRACRIGQTEAVHAIYLAFNNSLDAKMAHTLVEKMLVIDAAMDGATEIDISNIKSLPVIPRPKGEIMPAKFPVVSPELKATIHTGLRRLDEMCDGARAIDGHGFNKFDSFKGKSLSRSANLTDGQAYLGAILVNKYRKQLGEVFYMAAKEVLELKAKPATKAA